ncbi:MAG: PTS sugar transporter subunit IIA [Flexilinea sp.]|nr:PTS sugar transporter subunit IIA [Flexilinea sp.]
MAAIQIRINTRQRSMLYAILNSNGHMTLKEISEKTGYSVRVVRYNMPVVISWLSNAGIATEARPGHGYEFGFTRAAAQKLLDSLDSESEHVLNLTRDQRLRIELMYLLLAEKQVSFQTLAENEGISRSTVVTDTAQMEAWLKRFNLELVKAPNRGTSVRGSELFRRCALIDLIRREIGMVKYYGIWMDRQGSLDCGKTMPKAAADYLETLDFRQCYGYIDFIEKGMGLHLALFSRVEIILYLAIVISELKRKKGKDSRNHRFSRELFPVEDGIETKVADALMNRIGRDYGPDPDETERNFMAVMLLFSKWDNEDVIFDVRNEYTKDRVYNISHEALTCADMITAACANQLHPLLQTDEELIISLARHFHTVFNQINYGYPIFNENLNLILREYPEIFRSVNSEISLIEDQIHHSIPPEEIGYIVMYMVSALNRLQTEKHFRIPVVILGDGIRTRTIFLKDRLQLFFPLLEVVAMINGFPEDQSILDQAQLILSLIPGVQTSKPVIEISPFLLQNEIRVIQNWIIEHEESTRESLLKPMKMPDLIDLLRPENIILGVKAAGWKDAIHLAARPLEEQKLIKPEFSDAMIRLTEELGPYTVLGPGVVLLNARPNDGVNKLCMSLLILDSPVDFGTSMNFSIAFVLGASDNHSHLNALFQLSKICEQKDFIAGLKQCTRTSEVLRLIWLYSSDISLSKLM